MLRRSGDVEFLHGWSDRERPPHLQQILQSGVLSPTRTEVVLLSQICATTFLHSDLNSNCGAGPGANPVDFFRGLLLKFRLNKFVLLLGFVAMPGFAQGPAGIKMSRCTLMCCPRLEKVLAPWVCVRGLHWSSFPPGARSARSIGAGADSAPRSPGPRPARRRYPAPLWSARRSAPAPAPGSDPAPRRRGRGPPRTASPGPCGR